jgi:hypothetical protein
MKQPTSYDIVSGESMSVQQRYYQPFMETQDSLPHSRELITGPYRLPGELNLEPYFFKVLTDT